MASGVRIGGTWRPFTGIHVRVSGSWQPVTAAYVRVGGVWQTVYSSGPSVSMSNYASDVGNIGINVDVYDQYRIDVDGTLDRQRGAGSPSYTNLETWLDSGSNSEVWAEISVSGTALDSSWAGRRRLDTAGGAIFGYVTTAGVSTKSGTVTVTFYDAASGGNILDTADVALYAERQTI